MYFHPDPLEVIGWMAQPAILWHSQLYSGTASYIVAQPATTIFSLSLSNWTWDTFLTLRGTQGFYLNHVLPPRPSKSYRVDGTAGYIVAQPAIWWMAQLAI